LIPKNFDVLAKEAERSAKPVLIKKWDDCTDLWYKKDDSFERPKCIINMNLYTNDLLFSLKPESRVFAKVWAKVLDEYLREFNYMASEAKLEFGVSVLLDRIHFEWSGFNDSMPVFINETLARIQKMKTEDLSQIFE